MTKWTQRGAERSLRKKETAKKQEARGSSGAERRPLRPEAGFEPRGGATKRSGYSPLGEWSGEEFVTTSGNEICAVVLHLSRGDKQTHR